MAYTDINSEDRLVQQTFADHLEKTLGWDCVYAWNKEAFGPDGTLGRASERDVVLVRDLRAALAKLNPTLPPTAIDQALARLTHFDYSRSLLQHNQTFHSLIRDGVPVSYHDAQGALRHALARVIDFRAVSHNRFLAVRELKITGLRTPNYNRRADLVCFVNGLPLVFIELKAVYKNIRAGFDGNLRDYLDENVIAHAFHHNAFLIVSNGHHARYGSITSAWEHFGEWKRLDEREKGSLAAEVLLDGMLARERLLDLVENFILFDASKAGGVRKVVARNHQWLGVNQAVAAVVRQEALKRQFPPGERLKHRVIELPLPPVESLVDEPALPYPMVAEALAPAYQPEPRTLQIIERAHPDLGRLGVVWHTQGSGKSYSMAFFAEKVRRTVEGNFTFVLMTDRDDLDSQICIDKITCARMLMLVEPKWKAKAASVRAAATSKLAEIAAAPDDELRQILHARRDRLLAKATWLDETIIEIIISEAQKEVEDFRKWGFDIIPHRARMTQGFETRDGKRVDVESAFKNPQHPFRVAIVCAMWLTGFDVECLSTLYIDKPMRAHTLMQAIARANRRFFGKDFGLIVDYNGMLRSLREALAQYALGDDGSTEEIVAPLAERVTALQDAIEYTEAHLHGLGFDSTSLLGAKGFDRTARPVDGKGANAGRGRGIHP